jgi:hypothetical protein
VSAVGDGGCYHLGGDHNRATCCASSDGRSGTHYLSPCYYNPATQACQPLTYIEDPDGNPPLTGFACP